MSLSQLLFSFQGRLNRKPYWMTAIAITVLMIVLIVIAIAFFAEREIGAGIAIVVLIALLYIPLIWVGLAVGAKRLHDRELGFLRGTIGPNRYGPDPLPPLALPGA